MEAWLAGSSTLTARPNVSLISATMAATSSLVGVTGVAGASTATTSRAPVRIHAPRRVVLRS